MVASGGSDHLLVRSSSCILAMAAFRSHTILNFSSWYGCDGTDTRMEYVPLDDEDTSLSSNPTEIVGPWVG